MPQTDPTRGGHATWMDALKEGIRSSSFTEPCRQSPMVTLKALFPIASWLPVYAWRQHAKSDVIAGLTVGVVIIPQAMAYATLAGLPVVYGLYSCLVPLIVYAFMGTSKYLSVAPFAITSLLVQSSVSPLIQDMTQGALGEGSHQYIQFAQYLALLTGLMSACFGIFRLGFIVDLISGPVIHGFVSASAIIIATSQLPSLLGFKIERSSVWVVNVYRILTAAPQISWLTALIGIPCVASLAFLKARYPRFPRALAVIVAAELLVLGLYKAVPEISEDRLRGDGDGFWWPPRIPILGAVAGGVPVPRVPWATMPMPLWNSTADAFGPPTQISPASYTGPLLVPAMMIATIGFVSSMAVSQNYAKHFHDDPPRPNQELLAFGVANSVGSLCQGFVVYGGLARTAVNVSAGAKSQVTSVITALVVLIALTGLMPLLYYLPSTALAALIIQSVWGLVAPGRIRWLWRAGFRVDAVACAVTFGTTLAATIQIGLVVGIGAGVVALLGPVVWPGMQVLGMVDVPQPYVQAASGRRPNAIVPRAPPDGEVSLQEDDVRPLLNTDHCTDSPLRHTQRELGGETPDHRLACRNIQYYPEARRYPGILMLRIDAPLCFLNMARVEARLIGLIERELLLDDAMEDTKDLQVVVGEPSMAGSTGIVPAPNEVDGTRAGPLKKFVILHAAAIHHMDFTAAQRCTQLCLDLRDRERGASAVNVLWVHVNGRVRGVLESVGAFSYATASGDKDDGDGAHDEEGAATSADEKGIPWQHMFMTMTGALAYAQAQQQRPKRHAHA